MIQNTKIRTLIETIMTTSAPIEVIRLLMDLYEKLNPQTGALSGNTAAIEILQTLDEIRKIENIPDGVEQVLSMIRDEAEKQPVTRFYFLYDGSKKNLYANGYSVVAADSKQAAIRKMEKAHPIVKNTAYFSRLLTEEEFHAEPVPATPCHETII